MSIPVELRRRLSSHHVRDRHQALRELSRTCPWEDSRPLVHAMRRDPARVVRFQARDILAEAQRRRHRRSWLHGGQRDLAWLLLSFDGRIGRATWWLSTMVLTMAAVASAVLCVQLAGPVQPDPWMLLAVHVPLIWATLAVHTKRFHDVDLSGWCILASLVPVAGLLWVAAQLSLGRGSVGDNRHGSRGA